MVAELLARIERKQDGAANSSESSTTGERLPPGVSISRRFQRCIAELHPIAPQRSYTARSVTLSAQTRAPAAARLAAGRRLGAP
jgi:hypothetical protein